MEALQNRIDSFSKSKRVKNPSKSSSYVSLKWPHPSNFKANPESLAEAGFFFTPSFQDRDNVTCYMCEKQLGGWETEDDPFDIHWTKCGTSCCWASVRCGLRGDMDQHEGYVFSDKTRLPTSKTMERARLETFSAGDGWIHDQEKNHGANSRNMARAGFVYIPQLPGDDLATCLYCNISLSGWDADDEPMEEHRKRDKKNGNRCPFFNLSESTSAMKPPARSQSRPQSKTSSKTRSASASKQKGSVAADGSDGESEAPPASSSKRPTRGRTPGTGKPSRNQLGNAAEHEDIEGDEEQELVPVVKGGRAKRTNVVAAQPKGRTRSKSVARQILDTEEEAEEIAAAKTTSRTRSKMKEQVVPTSRAKAKPSSSTSRQPRKPSRTRSKAAVPTDQDSDEADDLDAMIPLKKRAASTSKAGSMEPGPPKSRVKPQPVSRISLVEEAAEDSRTPEERVSEQDEMDVPARLLRSEVSPSDGKGQTQVPINETVEDLSPLLIPKSSIQPSTPASDRDGDIEMYHQTHAPAAQSSSVPLKLPVTKQLEPLLQLQEKEARKGKKGSILKVVEISTDEEDVADVEEFRKQSDKQKVEPPGKEEPVEDAMLKGKGNKTDETQEEPRFLPDVAPTALNSEDVEMTSINGGEERGPTVVPQDKAPKRSPPVTPTHEKTTRAGANHNATTDNHDPAPVCAPLSKLPFIPLQNLADAELDMTVEEWIRYQMEVEYDKFRRDGQRELSRFKQRADEVRKIIEKL